MKGKIPQKTGLPEFIKLIRTSRDTGPDEIVSTAAEADKEMYREGIVLCADICNNDSTFDIKAGSRIKYINLAEVFGIDPEKASVRLEQMKEVCEAGRTKGLPTWLVPHSLYSVSLTLLRLILSETALNKITSIHFMESQSEVELIKKHTGKLMTSYMESGLIKGNPETISDHASAILEQITTSGNLILVHNIFVDKQILETIRIRKNLFWCLCPGSNLFIEDAPPPVELLVNENCNIVVGTDSLASNNNLSVLSELKCMQTMAPSLSLSSLIEFATINGAEALGESHNFGSIAKGKKPGLLLLEEIDFQNMKLKPGTCVTRLI